MSKTSLNYLCLEIMLLGILLGCQHAQNDHVLHPETGYDFPPTSDIKQIQVTSFGLVSGQREVKFNLPNRLWQDILKGLTPSESTTTGTKWEGLADLDISTKDQVIHVTIFDTHEALGAFAAGRNLKCSHSYRGGNSDQIKQTLRQAYFTIVSNEGNRSHPGEQ